MTLGNSLTTQVHSGASGTTGCGAITFDNRWLEVQWLSKYTLESYKSADHYYLPGLGGAAPQGP